ncbi:MFS transporter Fmp42 [Aspergillus heteromorphus CBS 117.55]|uniref:MFS transporter Fmp42 n=1 Tax=Aspergillus heteromorphus CBS 117.55 TaxID=1448321 RepID=A0A317VT18_9EURO|nr:MFS transporter Fmp42 [Aspergillus heteromorphus CBS 117.55]PWY77065.1 MFS transporter Fmp42 [Aspergillus heteromorphus CBS 117.55]
MAESLFVTEQPVLAMSLNRVSYLESWEQNPAAFRRQQRPEDSDGEDSYHDLPETSLASSFQSNLSHHSFRQRLNFNPYAGPGWSQTLADDPDRHPLLRDASPRRTQADLGTDGEPPQEEHVTLKVQAYDGPETTGAFEVGHTKRILQVCIAVMYCLFAAGIIFGFAAIKPVLIKEGVYRSECSQDELDGGSDVCYGQELRLNLMFTIAAVVTNVSALPVGTILDAYGPQVCGIIGSVSLAVGTLLFGLAPKVSFDAYLPGYVFVALGGPFIFISSFHLSNAFPTRSGLILSMLTGAFDASSALFLIFRLLYENTGGAFTPSRFFLAYLVVPIVILAAQLTVMPTTSYKTAGELVQEAQIHRAAEATDQIDQAINDRGEGERQRNDRRLHRQTVINQIEDLLSAPEQHYAPLEPVPAESKNPHTSGGVWGALHGISALRQIRTPWFVLIMLFTVLQMLRINYFVATIRQQYTYLLHSPALAQTMNSAFDILLPLGGLASVPFIGVILDNARTPAVLSTLVVTATLIGILGCIPNTVAGYANIVCFVVYRPFYYTAVSDYASKVFGFQTFGKVYGLVICLAGLGNFAQAGLDTLTFRVFHRDPVPVNALLTVTTFLVGVILVTYVTWQANRMAILKAEEIGTDPAPLENGLSVPAMHDGVDSRDWGLERDREREPLIRPIGGGDPSSYGTSGP